MTTVNRYEELCLRRHIAVSVSEVLSVFRTGTLRDHDEVDYLYFKINRREHILALSLQMLQVSDVEFKAFQCVRNATELISSELDKASNTDDLQYCMEKVEYTEGAVTVFRWVRFQGL